MDTRRDETQDLTEQVQPLRRDETVVITASDLPRSFDDTLIGGVEEPRMLALAASAPAGGSTGGEQDAEATQFIGSPFTPPAGGAPAPTPGRRPRKVLLLAGALIAVGLGVLAARGFAPSQAELAETPAPIEEQVDQPVLAGLPLEPGASTVARFDLDPSQPELSALDGQGLELGPTLAEAAERLGELPAVDPNGEAALLAQAIAQQEAELLGQAPLAETTESAPAESAAASESSEPAEAVAEESAPSEEQPGEASLELADQGPAIETAAAAEPAVEQVAASQGDDEDDDEDDGQDGRAALSQLGPAAEQAVSRLGIGR